MKIINTADDKAIYGKWAGTEYAKQLERKKHPADTTAVERLVYMKKPTNSISVADWMGQPTSKTQDTSAKVAKNKPRGRPKKNCIWSEDIGEWVEKPLVSKDSKKQTKRKVSEALKKQVAAAQSWDCKACRMRLSASYEVDHIVPLSAGGTNDRNNLQALCRNCHGEKTNRESQLI
jgi:5-methylcytosine-specific restriction endonuclease McrA